MARFRYQKGWSQEMLAAKMQLLGCYITRDIIANIETRRSVVTDIQIEFFTEAFGVAVGELFPQSRSTISNGFLMRESRAERNKWNCNSACRHKRGLD